MPHGFEYIVRPYQAPGWLGKFAIPSSPRGTPDRAHLVWGGKGTMPQAKLINPNFNVKVCHETANELTRTNERARIMGNDGESYVDVDRPLKMTLDKTETTNGSVNQSSSTKPKVDPLLGDTTPFEATKDDTDPQKRCGLDWSFKPQI